MTTLKITVGNLHELDQQTQRGIKAAQKGDPLEEAKPVLNFASYHDLARLLSPKNLEILDAIARSDPESIRDVAELVDRDYKQVHRNVTELDTLGVITLQGYGAGRPKKPILVYDLIEIDIPFHTTDPHHGEATPEHAP